MGATVAGHFSLELEYLGTALILVAAFVAAGHAVLSARDTRAAVGWIGLIILVPLVGTVLYLLLGINRIRRRAVALRAQNPVARYALSAADVGAEVDQEQPQLRALARLMRGVTGEHLLAGHRVTPLDNGDEAYPRMLRAIEAAEHSVLLSTYIFEVIGPGADFVDALARAQERGVQVRVLVDAVGLRYSRPRANQVLAKRGVRVAAFLPARSLGYSRFYNLRNHRKILVIDGRRAFTGGMNVRAGHVLDKPRGHPIRDLHFELEGPVCTWLTGVFAEDWEFVTGEVLRGEPFFREALPVGPTLARGVVDGPDADFEKFRWALMGSISCAVRSVRVVTPYFLPDAALQTALNLAALRGVQVDVVLPECGNLPVVNWAMRAHLAQEMDTHVRYWLTPAPFDHTKLLVIDEAWALIGTANWDPRSLRLNFEVGVECYDHDLAHSLARRVDERIARAHRLTAEDLGARSLPMRLRDGTARLLAPYL